jgi:hypothetical protein
MRPVLFALLAAHLGLAVAVAAYLGHPVATLGSDIDQAWWMARELFQGRDPYASDQALRLFLTRVYYPLTTAIVASPLALLPIDAARVVFVCGSAGLLGYAIGKERPYLWPTFLSVPFLYSLRAAQWGPLLTSAMIFPSLGWLAAAKPNLGVVMLAVTRTKREALILIGGGIIVLAVSLAVQPTWPWAWRDVLATATHFKPLLLRPGGPLLLLGLLRWRDPDARLVLALGLVPLTGTPYDALPLCLVARSPWQAASLTLLSYGTAAAWLHFTRETTWIENLWSQGSYLLWFGLFPALALVLIRREPVAPESVAHAPGLSPSRD